MLTANINLIGIKKLKRGEKIVLAVAGIAAVGGVVAACVTGFFGLLKSGTPSSAVRTQIVGTSNSVGTVVGNGNTQIVGSENSFSASTVNSLLNGANVNGPVIAPISPTAPINLTVNQNYYTGAGSNLPDIAGALSNLQSRLSQATNDIYVSRLDLLELTKAVSQLAQKTVWLDPLADGRTRFGSFIAGLPTKTISLVSNAIIAFQKQDWTEALAEGQAAVLNIEKSDRPNILQAETSYRSTNIGVIYYVMGASAQNLRSNSLALGYAEKAVELYPVPPHKLLLATAQMNSGYDRLRLQFDPAAAFVLTHQALTNYESLSGSDVSPLLSPSDLSRFYIKGLGVSVFAKETNDYNEIWPRLQALARSGQVHLPDGEVQ